MKKIIRQVLKTEMDRRLERVREYLLTQEQFMPIARAEYDKLMGRLLGGPPRSAT